MKVGTIHIHGGIPLQGQVKIQGSKNAVLPLLAGTVLVRGSCMLHGCPRIADVYQMQTLLESLGCAVRWESGSIRVDAERVCPADMPREAVTGMRSSLTLLGAVLGRCGRILLEHPGGCVIGERPMDMHISALERMNVKFEREGRLLHAWTEGLRGAEIRLEFPSVGATENVILAAVLAQGRTVLYHAAREPEIVSLCGFLRTCGARIGGDGTDCIRIEGVERLRGAEYTVPGDRIVAGTYLFACMSAGGSVFLEDAPAGELQAVIQTAQRMGACCQDTDGGLYVQAPGRAASLDFLSTRVYPGFPTDLQSPILSVLAGAQGESVLEETVFENRFRIVPELIRMGARIRVEGGRTAYVSGTKLKGASVTAEELRGGAALVIAGLGAQGETVIGGKNFIDRGYVNICRDLRELGARIYSV